MSGSRLRARFSALAADPYGTAWRIYARQAPDRIWQKILVGAREAGLAEPRLVMSWDCDTEEDIEVATAVFQRLQDLGVPSTFAVPGELLKQGAEVYRALAERGARFLNHGGVSHARRDPETGVVTSTLFYDQLSSDELRQDVQLGHDTVGEVLGVPPDGFRAPHFGTFQRPGQIRQLHRVLGEMGYRFSTSTAPLWAYRKGPAFRTGTVLELPVTGADTSPLRILDSWSYFAAPDRVDKPSDFEAEGRAVAARVAVAGCGLLNFYADPMHVHKNDVFFRTVAAWAEVARPTTYADVIAELDRARSRSRQPS